MTTDWLACVTVADGQAICRQIWTLDVLGETWRAATNGQRVVAVRTPGAPVSTAPECLPIIAFIDPSMRGAVPVDPSALQEWIGAAWVPPTPVEGPCAECHADGEIQEHECADCEHLIDCPSCEGTGTQRATRHRPRRPGVIGVAVVDLELLADIWPHLTPGPVLVRVTGASGPIYFAGPDWRVVVMPLSYSRNHPDYPTNSFSLPTTESILA